MGKTNPTYRDTIRQFENDWSPYHRALRQQYKPHFERLFDQARNFADAGGIQNSMDPMNTHLISIMLAQECRIAALEEEVSALEEEVNTSLDHR
ncbi:hypothetical protein SAMN05421809_3170 [Natronorubrum daqingense]|uniref:DUF8156 domain-containing protein n=1 Tax=Natronorubrum daqingense TaxID=588898 RepID=A0A1N7FFC6_9EURY|nr:hypothetical protein BB347_16935 [Natronorubrum daqingense]SIR99004.1 hypothetical protein SAMN05421809_3170 [Natronorubrum daqingense]